MYGSATHIFAHLFYSTFSIHLFGLSCPMNMLPIIYHIMVVSISFSIQMSLVFLWYSLISIYFMYDFLYILSLSYHYMPMLSSYLTNQIPYHAPRSPGAVSLSLLLYPLGYLMLAFKNDCDIEWIIGLRFIL